MAISPSNRLKTWVRCGGRCVLCNKYLMVDEMVGKAVTMGELAHIVAQSVGPNGPRGHEELDPKFRDDPDNLVLACPNEHDAFDRPELTGLITRAVLERMKSEHEARILHLTGLGHNRRTAVIRLVANLRGNAVDVSRDDVAAAAVGNAGRFPHYPMTAGQQGVEIDLRQIPGEVDASADYYAAATKQIDEVLDRQYFPLVVGKEHGPHVSLFAFARIPILVYFGARLGDEIDADIYDKHRDAGWAWPAETQETQFKLRLLQQGESGASVALIVNASGTVPLEDIQEFTSNATTYAIEPAGGVIPRKKLVASARDLKSFQSAFDEFLGEYEKHNKSSEPIHLFAAAPTSVAVAIGRAVAKGIHPPLVTYDRVTASGPFVRALVVNAVTGSDTAVTK